MLSLIPSGERITPEISVEAMTRFYRDHRIVKDLHSPDDDMLLFQYGTYDWDGKGAAFDLDLTRQVPNPEEEEFFQLRLTLRYRPGDIGDLKSFNLWSINSPSLTEWVSSIKQSEGYVRASNAIPFEYNVTWTQT